MRPQKKELEWRNFNDIEVRQESEERVLAGYAAVFDSVADLGHFTESLDSKCFNRSLEEGADVRALLDHDPSKLLGRNKAQTLNLKVDKRGLYVEINLPDTTVGRDTYELVKRGDLSQMSFGFRTKKDQWEEKDNDIQHRTVMDVDLFDISPVTFPAYQDTEIYVRSIWEAREAVLQEVDKKARQARQRQIALQEVELQF